MSWDLWVEIEREAGGRWIADVEALPGCMVYGSSRDEALARVQALALHVIADRLEHGEVAPGDVAVTFRPAA